MAAEQSPSGCGGFCKEISDFADEINRIHTQSPTQDQVCCPRLDTSIAGYPWLTPRCVLTFGLLLLLLAVVIIILSTYCANNIPCS